MSKFLLPKFLQQLFVLLALTTLASAPHALDMSKDQAAGPVVLKINGKIGTKNTADGAVFDDALLDALPQKSFMTETPWTKGLVKFTGPLLSDVLKAVNASGTNIKAIALNDYKVNIPVEDARKYGVILARQMDGKMLAIRDKGPLFVMYPFEQFPELKTSGYFSRCIWQLHTISVE
jgi:hypothetical protein